MKRKYLTPEPLRTHIQIALDNNEPLGEYMELVTKRKMWQGNTDIKMRESIYRWFLEDQINTTIKDRTTNDR